MSCREERGHAPRDARCGSQYTYMTVYNIMLYAIRHCTLQPLRVCSKRPERCRARASLPWARARKICKLCSPQLLHALFREDAVESSANRQLPESEPRLCSFVAYTYYCCTRHGFIKKNYNNSVCRAYSIEFQMR